MALQLVTMDKINVTICLDDLFTSTGAGKYCGVSRMTIWRWVQAGKLTPVVVAGQKLFHKKDLESLKAD